MKAGKYYIGDPCYVFRGKQWHGILFKTDYFKDGTRELFGYEICAGGTAYGDGTYYDNYGREYFVDAGLLSIIPIELFNKKANKRTKKDAAEGKGMHIVDMKEDFECTVGGGIFHFGDIVINTRDMEDENEKSE